jgi:uncharacterized protein
MAMRIQVAIARPERQEVIELELPEGSTVADALAAVGHANAPSVGIWSRACKPEAPLREGDRVEIYRPLRANPREMRRARARLKPSNRSRSGP